MTCHSLQGLEHTKVLQLMSSTMRPHSGQESLEALCKEEGVPMGPHNYLGAQQPIENCTRFTVNPSKGVLCRYYIDAISCVCVCV